MKILKKFTNQSNKDITITYFAPCTLGAGIGGSARLEDIITILKELKFNINLISYLPSERFEISKEFEDGLNKINIRFPERLPKFLKLLSLPLIIYYGIKKIRDSDIIFSHSPSIVSGFPALILSKSFNKPLIVDHMDVNDPDTPQFIFDKVINNSNIVFTISNYLDKEIQNEYFKRSVYLPIFVDTKVFKRDNVERINLRQKLGLKNEILIGYAGSFWNVEGVPILIKAFKNLSESFNVKLIIIGGGNAPGSDDIHSIIDKSSLHEKVFIIPQIPRESIPKYLSACDILCSPKIDCEVNRAANPVKIVEYLSMDIPTVSSAVGGAADIIQDGVNGFLVKPGSIKSLEDKLEWIIMNNNDAKKISEEGRKTIINGYSPYIIKKIIENSIYELI